MASNGPFAGLWRDKWLLAAAFIVLWQVRAALSIRGFRQPQERCARTVHLPAAPPALVRRVALSLARAARLVVAPTCLVRAAAGQRLLEMKGYGSAIQVGVRRSPEGLFQAHAWLMSGGVPVVGGEQEDLTGFQLLIGAAE